MAANSRPPHGNNRSLIHGNLIEIIFQLFLFDKRMACEPKRASSVERKFNYENSVERVENSFTMRFPIGNIWWPYKNK